MIGTSVMEELMSLLEKNSCKVGSTMFEWDLFTHDLQSESIYWFLYDGNFNVNELRLKKIRFGKIKKITRVFGKKVFSSTIKNDGRNILNIIEILLITLVIKGTVMQIT